MSTRVDLDRSGTSRRRSVGPKGHLATSVMSMKTEITSVEPKWRVLIAHPGRQHSHQAALALHQAGYLACYATGLPVVKRQLGRVSQRLLRRFSLYDKANLPLHLPRLNMIAP